ncbi:hypothetical protein AB0B89_30645 [Sphaerisporangium sp. NPDC049002]|uniref:hypothetical protein n=1 Tax=unclassified Sphaerisporangium TaxID=2630420 RepID=UPI0033C8B85B
MAVPPIQAAGFRSLGRVNRLPLVLDVIVGLLTAVALPLAIVTIPNTISVVSALLPPELAGVGILRAHGLALPVMLCTVPLAGAVLRRFQAAPILVAGLALLAAADVAGGFAGSTFGVGALRVLHGVGAGMLVPATFAASWERPGAARGVLVPVWAGALAVSLLGAQALALWPLDDVTSWRVTLQPYPLLTGLALALAAVYFVLSRLTGETADARAAETARGHLVLAAGPSVGIAVLAFGTTFNWPSGLIVAAAGLALVMLLAMSCAGRIEGPGGRALAFVMVAVGLVVLPTAAQVTYVELGGLGGPGLSGMWAPFGLAAVIAFAAALVTGRMSEALVPRLVGGGLVTMVVGLCAVRLFVPAPSGLPLVLPFTLLTAGAAVAVTSALRGAGLRAALFGLSLCFPAVLSGFLLGTGIQVDRLRAVSSSGRVTSQAMVDGFVGALHIWALVAGFAVVVVLAAGAVLARRSPEESPASSGALLTTPSPLGERIAPRGTTTGETTTRKAGGERSPGDPGAPPPGDPGDPGDTGDPGTAMIPVVPPPARSPEATTGEDGQGPAAR